MTLDAQKSTRKWRASFSIRTLVILVTLVCAYFGAWEATKRRAIKMYNDPHGWEQMRVMSADSPAPFLLRCREYNGRIRSVRHFYVWLFGPTIKLPFETELPDPPIPFPPETVVGYPTESEWFKITHPQSAR